jgi:hypothetical protein
LRRCYGVHAGIVQSRTAWPACECPPACLPSRARGGIQQWKIDLKDGQPRGFALVWRRFEISDLPTTLGHGDGLASALMRCTIKPREDSRMPAIREDDA